MIKRFASIVLAALAAVSAHAAEVDNSQCLQSSSPFFESYREGLASTRIYTMVEDSEGFLWLGTQNGITRFDGISFKNFFNVDSLTYRYSNMVLSMCDDTIRGCIWASLTMTPKLLCLDKKTYEQKELFYNLADDEHGYLKSNLRYIVNFNDSLLLGCPPAGLVFIHKETGVVRKIDFGGELVEYSARQFSLKQIDDKLYLLCDGHVFCAHSSRDPKRFLLKKLNMDLSPDEYVRRICGKSDNAVVIDVWNKVENKYYLYEYNLLTCKLTLLLADHAALRDLVCAADGIWMTSFTGMHFYDYQKKEERVFTTANSTLSDNMLLCIVKMRDQPVFFIGANDGLIKNDYYSSKFYITDVRRVSESSSCDLYSIHKDKNGNYWAWFIDGLFKRDADDGYFHKMDESLQQAIGKNVVQEIKEDTAANTLYFLSTTTLLSYNYKTGAMRQLSAPGEQVETFAILSNGTLLGMTSKSDGFYYDPKKNIRRIIPHGVKSVRIASMDLEGDTVLWIGSNNGKLYYHNLLTEESECVATIGGRSNKIDDVNYCYRDGVREVWFSVHQQGLYYYQPKYKKLTKVEYSEMLRSYISSVEIDKKQNVWVATQLGIVCINNNNGRIYEYEKSKFAMPQYFNHNASCVGYDGEVIMGGTNYFVEFDSENFSENEYFPTPYVCSYRYTNATALNVDEYTSQERCDARDTIRVPKGIRSVMLFARTLNYSKPMRNVIQWRQPDVSGEWFVTTPMEPITLTQFHHGANRIELRSCNQDGVPTRNVRTIIIDKDVYLYEYPAFQIACVFLGIALFLFFFMLKFMVERRQKERLAKEVERQAGDIRKANVVLLANKTVIENQNEELRRHRHHLEQIVEERTSELVVARQKAEESDKLKSAFLANLSHEVRTPMNCIVGFAKLLDDPSCPPEDRSEFIHLILESSNSLLVLLGDLLDVSRIEAGQLRVNKRPFDVWAEFQDVYGILKIERKSENVDFVLNLNDNVRGKTLVSDKDRFRQIIVNLTYNAFKFTEKGEVSINARIGTSSDASDIGLPEAYNALPMGELLFVSVKDSGIGMPADKLDVIFEPFRKLTSTKTLYPGLGLGLNIVKNLILALGGRIYVQSTEGVGTTFHFYLPLSDNDSKEAEK